MHQCGCSFINLLLMGRIEVVEKIRETIGGVEDIDVGDDNISWGRNLRIKVRVDLTKQIVQGQTITIKGMNYWTPMQYEN